MSDNPYFGDSDHTRHHSGPFFDPPLSEGEERERDWFERNRQRRIDEENERIRLTINGVKEILKNRNPHMD